MCRVHTLSLQASVRIASQYKINVTGYDDRLYIRS